MCFFKMWFISIDKWFGFGGSLVVLYCDIKLYNGICVFVFNRGNMVLNIWLLIFL